MNFNFYNYKIRIQFNSKISKLKRKDKILKKNIIFSIFL